MFVFKIDLKLTCLKIKFLVGVYCAYVRLPGPFWRRNQYIGIWLSTVLLFYSLQTFYVLMKKSHAKNAHLVINLIYFSLTTLAGLLLTVFYGLLARIDSALFSFFILLTNILSILTLIVKKNQSLNNIVATTEYELNNVFAESKGFNKYSNKTCISCLKKFLKVIKLKY